MKIAWMTTYNQVCGISDYSMSIVSELQKEHEVKIVAPILNEAHHSLKPVLQIDESNVTRCWNAAIWDGIVKIDLAEISRIADWADVFHIQFQDALYHHEWFMYLIERVKPRAKLVVTLHDTCLGKIWPLLPAFDVKITMKPEVQRQVQDVHLLPMPMHDHPPVLKGFGLGRSKHENIQRVCDELGYKYEYKKAENEWLPIDALISWLRDSDGIVLYYDDVETAGSSAAARTAISTRRPVFLNRVTWFNDVPEGEAIWFTDDESLKSCLYDKLNRDYINTSGLAARARSLIELYSA